MSVGTGTFVGFLPRASLGPEVPALGAGLMASFELSMQALLSRRWPGLVMTGKMCVTVKTGEPGAHPAVLSCGHCRKEGTRVRT